MTLLRLFVLVLIVDEPEEIQYAPPSMGNDLSFIVANEEIVRSFTKANRLEAVIPAEHARLIRMLGCPTYDCRQFAYDLLKEKKWEAARSLTWGTWIKNESIRINCAGLLAQLACRDCCGTGLCSFCGGTGYFKSNHCINDNTHWIDKGHYDYIRMCVCSTCNGTGNPYKKETDE